MGYYEPQPDGTSIWVDTPSGGGGSTDNPFAVDSGGGGVTYQTYFAPDGPYGARYPAGTQYSVGSNGSTNIDYRPPTSGGGGGSTTIVNASTGGAHYTTMYGPDGYGTYETSSGTPILLGLKQDPNAPASSVNPADKNNDQLDDSTGFALGVYRDPTGTSPTGFMYGNGQPVYPNGAPYTGPGLTNTKAPTVTSVNGVPYIWDAESGQFVPAPGIDVNAGATSTRVSGGGSVGSSSGVSAANSAASAAAATAAAAAQLAAQKAHDASQTGDLRLQIQAQKDLQNAQLAYQRERDRMQTAEQVREFDASYGLQMQRFGLDKIGMGIQLASAYSQAINSVDPSAYSAFLTGLDKTGLSGWTGGNNVGSIASGLAAGRNAVSPDALKPAALLLDQMNALNGITAPAGAPPPAGGGVPVPGTGGTAPPPTTGGTGGTGGSGWTPRRPAAPRVDPAYAAFQNIALMSTLNNTTSNGNEIGAYLNYGAPGTVLPLTTQGTYNMNNETLAGIAAGQGNQAGMLPPDYYASPGVVNPKYAVKSPDTGNLAGDNLTGGSALIPAKAKGGLTQAKRFVAGDSLDGQPNPELVEVTKEGTRVTPLKTPRYATGTGGLGASIHDLVSGSLGGLMQGAGGSAGGVPQPSPIPQPTVTPEQIQSWMARFGQSTEDEQRPPGIAAALAARGANARANIEANPNSYTPINQAPGWIAPSGGTYGTQMGTGPRGQAYGSPGWAMGATGIASRGFAGVDTMGRTIDPAFGYDASWNREEPPSPLGFVGAFPTSNGAYTNPAGNILPPTARPPQAPGSMGNRGMAGNGQMAAEIQQHPDWWTVDAQGNFVMSPKHPARAPHYATGTYLLSPNATTLLSRYANYLQPRTTSTGGTTTPTPTTPAPTPAPAPSTIPGTTVNSSVPTTPISTQPSQSSIDQVYAQRMGTQYAQLNPYGTGYSYVDPVVRAQYELGQQATKGVPVASQQFESMHYRTPSGVARLGV